MHSSLLSGTLPADSSIFWLAWTLITDSSLGRGCWAISEFLLVSVLKLALGRRLGYPGSHGSCLPFPFLPLGVHSPALPTIQCLKADIAYILLTFPVVTASPSLLPLHRQKCAVSVGSPRRCWDALCITHVPEPSSPGYQRIPSYGGREPWGPPTVSDPRTCVWAPLFRQGRVGTDL